MRKLVGAGEEEGWALDRADVAVRNKLVEVKKDGCGGVERSDGGGVWALDGSGVEVGREASRDGEGWELSDAGVED